MNTLEFPTVKLQEHVNMLRHLNIVVPMMLIQRLQDLQMDLLKEIKSKGDEAHQELMKMMDERS